MADETQKKRNGGVYVDIKSEEEDPSEPDDVAVNLLTLQAVLYRLITTILFPSDDSSPSSSDGLIRRIKISFAHNIPLFPQASRNTTSLLLSWARRGTPLRSILLISVGTITLLNLTGLLLFTLFFLAATLNALVISLLFSLAAAGGFFALFFASLTAIYIAALSVAAFAISITTISTVIAVVIATAWIGFFWTIWLLTRTSFVFAKRSLAITGSTLSAYSFPHRYQHLVAKHSDD